MDRTRTALTATAAMAAVALAGCDGGGADEAGLASSPGDRPEIAEIDPPPESEPLPEALRDPLATYAAYQEAYLASASAGDLDEEGLAAVATARHVDRVADEIAAAVGDGLEAADVIDPPPYVLDHAEGDGALVMDLCVAERWGEAGPPDGDYVRASAVLLEDDGWSVDAEDVGERRCVPPRLEAELAQVVQGLYDAWAEVRGDPEGDHGLDRYLAGEAGAYFRRVAESLVTVGSEVDDPWEIATRTEVVYLSDFGDHAEGRYCYANPGDEPLTWRPTAEGEASEETFLPVRAFGADRVRFRRDAEGQWRIVAREDAGDHEVCAPFAEALGEG